MSDRAQGECSRDTIVHSHLIDKAKHRVPFRGGDGVRVLGEPVSDHLEREAKFVCVEVLVRPVLLDRRQPIVELDEECDELSANSLVVAGPIVAHPPRSPFIRCSMASAISASRRAEALR